MTRAGDWILNAVQSAFIQRLDCASGAGNTSYALALEEAQHELERNGRGNVQDVIIFISDGAANTSPTNLPAGPLVEQPDQPATARAGRRSDGAPTSRPRERSSTRSATTSTAGSAAPEHCMQPLSNGHERRLDARAVRDMGLHGL